MMIRPTIVALTAALMLAGPATAETQKQTECSLQAGLMSTVQKARLNGVPKAKIAKVIQSANPDLSDNIIAVVPAIADHVYSIKRDDLKKVDLGKATMAQCLENWDQIQEMKKTVTN